MVTFQGYRGDSIIFVQLIQVTKNIINISLLLSTTYKLRPSLEVVETKIAERKRKTPRGDEVCREETKITENSR